MTNKKFCDNCPTDEEGDKTYCSECSSKQINKLNGFNRGFSARHNDEEVDEESNGEITEMLE
jgi:hypothetical protein